MAKLFGQAFFPGVKAFISCTATATGHGITPSMATLEIPSALHDPGKIPPIGTLVITDGQRTVSWRRAKVTSISFPRPGVMVLHIVDRRWQWAFGTISGNWNQIDPSPDPDSLPDGEFVSSGGPYQPGTYRLAVNMMADCFVAMNELDPRIDPSPTFCVPVQWNSEVPAQALASLAEQIGYRVVFQPCADHTLVCPQGVGLPLPEGLPIIEESASVDLPERPNELRLHGGNTLFHDFLELEPVGLETQLQAPRA